MAVWQNRTTMPMASDACWAGVNTRPSDRPQLVLIPNTVAVWAPVILGPANRSRISAPKV